MSSTVNSGSPSTNWLPDELVEVACDFCGSDNKISVVTRPDGLNVVECLRCGLAYLNPRPRAEFISCLYGKNYFLKEDKNLKMEIGYGDYAANANNYYVKGRSFELDLIERVRPLQGCQLLEVGCATGELLALARQRGAQASGVELSDYAAQLAQSRYDLEVHKGTLEEQHFSPGAFDVVLTLEVIEHVLSPTNFLKEIARILKPGGVAAISTPNYRCAQRWKEKWLGFQTSFEHLYFLSDKILLRMTSAHGFRPILWATTGSGLAPTDHDRQHLFKSLIKKIPLAIFLWNALKMGVLRRNSWEAFGQGHRLLMIFEKM